MAIHSGQLTIFRCTFCGVAMVDGRRDKKTCSGACRKRLSRWRQRMNSMESKAYYHIHELAEYLKFPDAREGAIKRLLEIQTEVAAVLHNSRVQAVK